VGIENEVKWFERIRYSDFSNSVLKLMKLNQSGFYLSAHTLQARYIFVGLSSGFLFRHKNTNAQNFTKVFIKIPFYRPQRIGDHFSLFSHNR